MSDLGGEPGAEGYGGPPRPGDILRLILPAFAVSTLIAVVGVVLVLTGHHTIGLVLVGISAVGGLFWRARLVMRAQQRRQPPD